MSERRPHWDQSLIDTVRTAMRPRILTISDSVDTYDVIAAVEDWHKAKRGERVRTHAADGSCWRWHEECAEALIESQQDMLQRVQNALVSHKSIIGDPGVSVIRRALDGGESDE